MQMVVPLPMQHMLRARCYALNNIQPESHALHYGIEVWHINGHWGT
jgi:hypothetical protein